MDKEVWWVVAGVEEASLSKTDPNTYELRVDDHNHSAAITLDRGHLKDLYHKLGDELAATNEG